MTQAKLFKHIYNRVNYYGKNWIQTNTGEAGTGKSECSLTQNYMIDRDFGIEKVSPYPSKILEAFENVTRSGECITFEEPQIGINARLWSRVTNITMNNVFTTFRYKHIVLTFTVIDFTYIDSQTRKALQSFSEVRRSGRNPPVQWFYLLSHDRKYGKLYFPHPRMRIDGELRRFDAIVYKRRAPEFLRREYERQMKREKDKVLRDSLKILKQLGMDKDTDVGMSTEEELKRSLEESKSSPEIRLILKNLKQFSNSSGKLDSGLIKERIPDMSYHRARAVKSLIENITGAVMLVDIQKSMEERGKDIMGEDW